MSFDRYVKRLRNRSPFLFEERQFKIERAFRRTGLPDQVWEVTDITQCLYATMQRTARTMLEQKGLLTPREKHANGTKWIFWAEEPHSNGHK